MATNLISFEWLDQGQSISTFFMSYFTLTVFLENRLSIIRVR